MQIMNTIEKYNSKHCRVWKIGNSLTPLKCEIKTHTKQNFVKVNETYVEDKKRAKDLRIILMNNFSALRVVHLKCL